MDPSPWKLANTPNFHLILGVLLTTWSQAWRRIPHWDPLPSRVSASSLIFIPFLLSCWVPAIAPADRLPALRFHAASLACLSSSLSIIHPGHHRFHHERILLKNLHCLLMTNWNKSARFIPDLQHLHQQPLSYLRNPISYSSPNETCNFSDIHNMPIRSCLWTFHCSQPEIPLLLLCS